MGKVILRGAEVRDHAIEIVKNGGTFAEASKATGFTPDYVRQLCTKAGIYKTKGMKAQEAIALLKQNIPVTEIKEICGYATDFSVVRLARENNIEPITINSEKRVLREKIIAYRKQGHYISECCKKFNVNKAFVNTACRGIDFPWVYDTDTMSHAAKQQALDREPDENIPINMMRRKAPGFEYVSGYDSYEGHIIIRCKQCGCEFDRTYKTIKQGNVTCPNCIRIESTKRAEEKEREREREREEKENTRWLEKNKRSFQFAFNICPECNNVFFDRKRKFCSDECYSRYTNRIKHDRRLRKLKQIIIDDNITLTKLYKRDNGVCHICGEVCDWNDYSLDDNNNFITGGSYPSIDHVIPISKGGLHSWGNVKLAHFYCNTIKSNKVSGYE